MGVQSQIERIKNTVTSQTELIQEISNILDSKSTPTPQKLQDKTITPTATNQVITADTGYGGLNTVTINGDAELVPENIKEGVNIFGVTGNMSIRNINLLDYSNTAYNTSSISYWDKNGSHHTNNFSSGTVRNEINNIDFTKQIVVDTNPNSNESGFFYISIYWTICLG